MAVTYGFYNALNHDRLYDAIQMSSIFDGIIRDGIFSTIGDTMIVTAPEDGMYVNVGSGRAWFNHTWTLNDTAYPIEAEEAEVVLDRIDAVILEVNSSAEVRANSIKFLKGTPSSNPVKPTLTHNAEVNQYALAYVRIRAGQTTIFQSDIENAVGTDETPLVTGVLQQVSIETLLKQWEAEFNTYFTNFKNTSTTEFNNWFATKVSEYTAWFAQMQTNMDSNFNEFDAWFQRMKDQLDTDQAGHLQLQIDTLNSDINALEAEMPFAGGSKVNINFEYDVVPNIQYSNEHYKLTVGDTVRENNFSSSKLHFDEYGILTVGDGILEVTYDITDSRTGKITHVSYTYRINMPYFGRFAYNVTISASLYNYQGWLYSIGKDASSYSTIEDVFADEKLLRELMTRHASVDYLVEWLANINEDAHTILNNDYCAKWINLRDYALDKLYANPTVKAVMDEVDKYGYGEWALVDGTWQPKGAVPVMTSNTAPYGEAFASSYFGSYDAFGIFSDNSRWTANTSTNAIVGYKFVNPICVRKIFINPYKESGQGPRIKNYKVQGSNNGTDYEDLLSGVYPSDKNTEYIKIDNNKYYLYYRLVIADNYTSYNISLNALQFYGRQLNVSVPTMTSNTAPWGEASANFWNSAYPPYMAFDKVINNDTNVWSSTSSSTTFPCWLAYDFKHPIVLKKLSIIPEYAGTGSDVKDYEIQASNDGFATYDVLLSDTLPNVTSIKTFVITIDNDKPYRNYRISITSTWRAGATPQTAGPAIIELNYYGLDYSEREFGEGSTMKYIYDHGVELEELVDIKSGSGLPTKESNQLVFSCTGNNGQAGFQTNNMLDLTNYKIFRTVGGNKFSYSNTNTVLGMQVDETKPLPYNVSSWKAFNNSNAIYLPNNCFMDISNINENEYCSVSWLTSDNTYLMASVTEWWLE